MRSALVPVLLNSAPGWVLPGASLDMDYVNARAWVRGRGYSAITDLLTTTRASTGYGQTLAGTLTNFLANTSRITTLGDTVEAAATNLLLQSQTFQTSWNTVSATVTADQAVAPDGTTTADLIFPTTTGADRFITQTVTKAASAIQYSYSVYLKGSSWTWVLIQMDDGAGNGVGKWFNIATSVAGTSRSFGTGLTLNSSGITALANGWSRLNIVVTTNSATTIKETIQPTDADNSTTATTSGTNGVYAWGADLKLGSALTSYVPTTTVAATRAADSAVVSLGNVTRIVFTFSDGTTQTISGITPNSPYTIPTNLNKPVIARLTGYLT